MKKIFLVLFLSILLFTGCENKEENEKNDYLDMKSQLLSHKEFVSFEELTCDIVINIDRKDEEKIIYEVVLSKPKENMNNIKAVLVHNYYTEDVFPTIGLFDDTKSLLVDSQDSITLKGSIKTDKDIDNLNLMLKLLIRYTTDDGVKKDIYYKTTK